MVPSGEHPRTPTQLHVCEHAICRRHEAAAPPDVEVQVVVIVVVVVGASRARGDSIPKPSFDRLTTTTTGTSFPYTVASVSPSSTTAKLFCVDLELSYFLSGAPASSVRGSSGISPG